MTLNLCYSTIKITENNAGSSGVFICSFAITLYTRYIICTLHRQQYIMRAESKEEGAYKQIDKQMK